MKKSRYSEEQIIGILKEHDAGMKTAELCRKHNISAGMFYQWKAKFGELDVNDAKKLRHLEQENAQLKRVVGGLAITVDTSIPGLRVLRKLDRLIAMHGKPEEIRVDNGPEMIGRAVTSWC